jgi:choline dehydrogenase-like flavoprotein
MAGVVEQRYDVVLRGAGTSRSVVARRLAANPDVSVFLAECAWARV